MPSNGTRPESAPQISRSGKGGSAPFRKIPPFHFFVYFFTGIATVFLGPILPLLARIWFISDAQAGSLFAAQFAGAALGSLLSTRRPSRSYPIGCACCAFAISFIGRVPWTLLLCMILLNGIGVGLIINSGNLLVADQAQTRGVSGSTSLAKVHFAWGAGALSCPWIIRAALQWAPLPIFFLFFGGAFGILMIWLLLKGEGAFAAASPGPIALKTTLSLRVQLFFAIALLLYAGAENAISGWLPSFAMRVYDNQTKAGFAGSTQLSSLGMLSFTVLWTMHLFGRGCIPATLRFVSEAKLFKGTLAALFVSVVVLAAVPGRFNDHGAVLCAAAAGCGISLASVYPLLMGNLLKQAGSPRGIGWVFTCGAVGAALVPWISGMAATATGNVRASLVVPAPQ